MNKKVEEMIAIAVAYAVNCQICMEYHKRMAKEAGLTKEEMQAAITIAEGIKTAAANMTKGNAASLFGEVKEDRCCPAGSECCP